MSLAIVPAAGKAARFGSAKLLSEIDGEPLVARTLRALVEGGVARVVLVIAPGSPLADIREPREIFGAPGLQIVVNPDPERGMLSSIQAGLTAAEGHPILVLPADMPFVRPSTVAAVLAAALSGGAVILPTCRGAHGHPVGLPSALRPAILSADHASTLKGVLGAAGIAHRELQVDDEGILRDVDVPQDLSAKE